MVKYIKHLCKGLWKSGLVYVWIVVGAMILILHALSPKNAPQSTFHAQTGNYTPTCEKPLTSEISGITEQAPEMSEPEPPRYEISDYEREQIELIVASEGGYCDYEFQALVAECILNACEADDIRPMETFSRGYFRITRNVEPTEVTRQAVSDVFDKGILPTPEKVRHYYNPNYCASPLHESKTYVLTCCDCRFFKD